MAAYTLRAIQTTRRPHGAATAECVSAPLRAKERVMVATAERNRIHTYQDRLLAARHSLRRNSEADLLAESEARARKIASLRRLLIFGAVFVLAAIVAAKFLGDHYLPRMATANSSTAKSSPVIAAPLAVVPPVEVSKLDGVNASVPTNIVPSPPLVATLAPEATSVPPQLRLANVPPLPKSDLRDDLPKPQVAAPKIVTAVQPATTPVAVCVAERTLAPLPSCPMASNCGPVPNAVTYMPCGPMPICEMNYYPPCPPRWGFFGRIVNRR